MGIPPERPHTRYIISLLLLAGSAVLLAYLSASWLAALCWVGGHLLSAWVLPKLDNSSDPALVRIWLSPVLAALGFVCFLSLLNTLTYFDLGWRGFAHLSNLPTRAWAGLLALFAPALAAWLLGLWQIQQLQAAVPDRPKRALMLAATAMGVGLLGLLPGLVDGFLPLALSVGVFLFSLDIYLENNRTSMTWLLLWLLLFSMIMAVFAYRQSLRIDLKAHQTIAKDIARLGVPDTTRMYHLPFQWDTLSVATAQARLLPEQRAVPPGQGHQWMSTNRRDWVYHRADGTGYVMVGRTSGGFRPPLALMSVLFLLGLGYCLGMRALAWGLRLGHERWLLPLFGPSSLQLRIQLSFFGMALLTFFLVSWFTVYFFREQSEFLGHWLEQLVSLYVFLLLIAGALGIFLANSITEPIVQIGRKLSDTRLQNNEPLTWPRNDEIGKLVNSYNRMISELDDSAAKLAEVERGNAWREMAKQVAHEIKNPLTPMKLQLQQLLRLEKDDPERAREWSKKVAASMIEQIDGLALIATEFSHFGRLPEANATHFDLRDLAQSAYALHSQAGENITLQLDISTLPCPVHADKDQLLRVLNNLIRNAIQACDNRPSSRITIAITPTADQTTLSVSDNGPGIPDEVRARIFQPNFTTKSSGMGLGLAMCRNIVEQAGGSIDFTTQLGEGTTFWVKLKA